MEKNPLRALDCKEEGCSGLMKESPSIQEFLCSECERDFDTVLEALGGLGSSYKINPGIVRGLDYYTKTTFEVTSANLGAQNAVAGGGRYDGLVRLLGGPNLPGVGFAIGIERVIELLKLQADDSLKGPQGPTVFIAPLGEKPLREAFRLAGELRASGVRTLLDYDGRSLKSQMRYADKIGARYVMIVGEEELKKKTIILRNLASKQQEELTASQAVGKLKRGSSDVL